MARPNSALAILAIGIIALIAGVGRLVQHFTQGEQVPNPPPVPVFVLAAAFGAVITSVALWTLVREFVATHQQIRISWLYLAIAGATVALCLAYFLGTIGVGR